MKLPHRRWMEIGAVAFVVIVLAALILPAIQQAREAARRSQSRNNLKQIGLALHNYHESFKCFPPGAVVDKSGVGHFGWSTQILPFLDASPDFAMLWMDYPWDDPVNRQIYQRVYPCFLSPHDEESGFTAEGFGVSSYTASPSLFFRNSSTCLADVADNSTAWAMAEVNSGQVPWGYPWNWREFPTDLHGDLRGFLSRTGIVQVLMVDGRVETFSVETDSKVLRSLNDGCPVPHLDDSRVPARVFDRGAGFRSELLRLTPAGEEPWERGFGLLVHRSGREVFARTYPIAKGNWRVFSQENLEFTLENVPDVTHLRIDDTVGEEKLKRLANLDRLESLAVQHLILTDVGIESLKRLSRLRLVTAPTFVASDDLLGKFNVKIRGKRVLSGDGDAAAENHTNDDATATE
jgi:hypothetical protein